MILALHLAKVMDSVISYEQSNFVKDRQILDEPLMVNEIQIGTKVEKEDMIFKVDFEKAYWYCISS